MKRRIIESDDEDTIPSRSIGRLSGSTTGSSDDASICLVKKSIKISTPDDEVSWLAPRDVEKISTHERQRNIAKAKLDRKAATSLRRRKGFIIDDDEEEEETPRRQPIFNGNDSFFEDTPVDSRKNVKKAANKNKKEPVKEILLSSDESSASGSETDASNNEYDSEELSNSDIEAKTKEILSECENLTRDLRKNLGMYSSTEKEATAVSLMDIDGLRIENDRVITNEDIKSLCPGLELKAYQLVGVNWIKLLHDNGINGVLADDMGLGKTVQTIAFLAWLSSKQKSLPSKRSHLIIVPASTLANWANEFERFCPSLEILIYHGTQKERNELQYTLQLNASENIFPDVILSTYTIFERDSGKSDRSFIYNQTFDYLVCDEGHCLKNSSSSRFVNVNHVRSSHRLLLSGTPVQNDVKELLALLSFSMKQLFKPSSCELLMQSFIAKSSGENKTGLSVSQVRSMLAPFVLRRVKLDVLNQLPPKTSTISRLSMTETQRQLYDSIIFTNAERKRVSTQIANTEKAQDKYLSTLRTATAPQSILAPTVSSISGPSLRDMSNSEANHLFSALRKAANHPLLLRSRYVDLDILDKIGQVAYANDHFGNQCQYSRVKDEILEMSDFDIHHLCLTFPGALAKYCLPEEALFDSPKMVYLRELLPQLIQDKHRVLIFSQWTKILDLISVLLEAIGFQYLRVDGQTPIRERQDFIDTFNRDSNIPVFLLSTKAGGLGINLSSADTVILHDLDFNPENDRQAEDRCHRIGQLKPVTVYKLVTEGTVDELIYDIGEKKRELSDAVLSSTNTQEKKASKSSEGDIGAIGWILQKTLQDTISRRARSVL